MNEFNLSDKIDYPDQLNGGSCLYIEDVKKFIRKLKDEIIKNDIYTADEIFRIINKLAGEELL